MSYLRQRRLLHLDNIWLALVLVSVWGLFSCSSERHSTIAVIPRTTGTMLWEPEHGGAAAAGRKTGHPIYWNAPTREDDVSAQIALVERAVRRDVQGLVLAPDQILGLMTPVRRAVAHGVFTVVVGSPLTIPAGDKLSYILNDDEEGGRIAARRVASILHGQGSVAVIGMNPDIAGVMIRARSFEQFLEQNDPGIHIVEKRMGSFNVPHEQQVSEELLHTNGKLNMIVALMWSSARGAMATIESKPSWNGIKVIGFDPDGFPFDSPSLDSIVAQNTREMGYKAVELIDRRLHGETVPLLQKIEPLLITRENVNSEQVRDMTSMGMGPTPLQSNRSAAP